MRDEIYSGGFGLERKELEMKRGIAIVIGSMLVVSAYGSVLMDLDFNEYSLDQTLATDIGVYDYTRDAAFVAGETTLPNSLVFKAGVSDRLYCAGPRCWS